MKDRLSSTTRILEALGYDDMGNNPDLLCERDKAAIDRALRVSGDATCLGCGELYRLHPRVQGALWLVRACDGLVKL
jgi:hypothetical protein